MEALLLLNTIFINKLLLPKKVSCHRPVYNHLSGCKPGTLVTHDTIYLFNCFDTIGFLSLYRIKGETLKSNNKIQ